MSDKKCRPFADLAYAMAINGPCVLCGKDITIHDMRGDQVIAENIGETKQVHRYCWEKKNRPPLSENVG